MQEFPIDWKGAAALMSKVYANCALNLAADSTISTDSNMSQDRTLEERCHLLIFEKTFIRKDYRGVHVLSRRNNSIVEHSHKRLLHTRAWVLQERILSM